MYTKDADFVQETANFEFFVANVNRLKPQFVVITGDLTNKTRRRRSDCRIPSHRREA